MRARLATLVLSAGLVLVAGCQSGPIFPWLSRSSCCCECNTCESGVSGLEGPVLAPTDGSFTTPPPPIGPQPRIIPQANPTPYQPTGLRRFFQQ
jgi:hypothetical protein